MVRHFVVDLAINGLLWWVTGHQLNVSIANNPLTAVDECVLCGSFQLVFELEVILHSLAAGKEAISGWVPVGAADLATKLYPLSVDSHYVLIFVVDAYVFGRNCSLSHCGCSFVKVECQLSQWHDCLDCFRQA